MDKFLNVSTKRDISNVSCSSKDTSRQKCRKYDDSYLNFGFTCTIIGNEERPQCVICLKVLATESMLPNKMKRHLESNHGSLVNKPREYFSRKLKEMTEQKTTFTKQATIPTKALLSSYKVAYRVAKSKKPHTIAEDLILPSAMDMVSIMIGESAAKQLASVPLSDNTISRRILDMADDINDQLFEKLKGDFAIQLDEATDSHNDAHLICYVRFIHDNKYHEDLLFCRNITLGTKAADLFEILHSFMEENNINWENCVGVCTDGGRSMAGCYAGLQALIRKEAPHAIWTHCFIHREALAAKNISPALHEVLQSVIEVVNFIKSRPLKSRCFQQMCVDMGAEHISLLYYSNSRWLSRGNVLKRVYELRNELHCYLVQEKHLSSEKFVDSDFVCKLAYLCDIFEKLNSLNVSLQGNETNILQLSDKISAFRKKLLLWKTKLDDRDIHYSFPALHTVLEDNDLQLSEELKSVFVDHLTELNVHFQKYFAEEVDQHNWIKDPFSTGLPSTLTTEEQEQFIDISSDSTLKSTFVSSSLLEFWGLVKQEYPQVGNKALRVLIPFVTSYLCEVGFSALAVIKTKYRSRLNVEKEMRVAVSNLVPRFEELVMKKQAHPSH